MRSVRVADGIINVMEKECSGSFHPFPTGRVSGTAGIQGAVDQIPKSVEQEANLRAKSQVPLIWMASWRETKS
jgi:hypothetical protein